jgi:glycosyltransferase involved in cell wall biosynthesis
METVDIVLTTRDRLDYLKRTLEHIYARTRSPHMLHVVDDGSTEGNADYLIAEWKAGRVHDLLLRGGRCGAMANLNAGAWLAFSDPVVFVDDDVLCPDVEPDWLERGTAAILARPNLAILAGGATSRPSRRPRAATTPGPGARRARRATTSAT